jgi:MFS family permease
MSKLGTVSISDTDEASMDSIINKSNKSASTNVMVAWAIWSTAAVFYLYEYVLRVSPGVLFHDLMRDFSISASGFSLLLAFYYFSYVPLQIPCGMIVDSWGPRRVITMSAALCVIGTFLFAYSTSLGLSNFARLLMGAGSACAYLSSVKIAAEWFAPQRFAVLAGVTMMMGTLGGIVGTRPVVSLVTTFGWRHAMLILAFFGVGVMLAAWTIIRDRPDGDIAHNKTAPHTLKDLTTGLKNIVTNSKSWCVGLYGCLMYMPLSCFAESWSTPFVMEAFGVDRETASWSSICIFVGMGLGCLVLPVVGNIIKSHHKVMSWSALGTLTLFSIAIYMPGLTNITFVMAILFTAGFVSGGQILYFAAAKEINPPEFAGTTIGFTNMLVMCSALVLQPVMGHLLDWVGNYGTLLPDGSRFYSVENYRTTLLAIPIGLFVAWIFLQFVPETHPDRKKSQ